MNQIDPQVETSLQINDQCQNSQKNQIQEKNSQEAIKETKEETKMKMNDQEMNEKTILGWVIKKIGEICRIKDQHYQIGNKMSNIGEGQKVNSKFLIIAQKEDKDLIDELKSNFTNKLIFFNLSSSTEVGISNKLKQEFQILFQQQEMKNSQPSNQIPLIDVNKNRKKNQMTDKNSEIKENYSNNKKQIRNSQKSYSFSKSKRSDFCTPKRLKYKQKKQQNEAISSQPVLIRQFPNKSQSSNKLHINSKGRIKVYYNDDTSFDIRTHQNKSENQSQEKNEQKKGIEQPIKPSKIQQKQNIQAGLGKENSQNIRNILTNSQNLIKQQCQEALQKRIKIQKVQNNQQFLSNIDEIRKQQWYSYLQCLSYAQTQLSYFAQHMGLSIKFLQSSSSTLFNMYCCTVQIGRLEKGVYRKYVGVCEAQKSKKQARHYASILCLAEIYSRNQILWQNFKEKKLQRAVLRQPLKSDNTQILKCWQKITDPHEVKISKQQNQAQYLEKPEIHDYIKGLKSCKHQLYYFVAQNNKIFMAPKWSMKKPNIHGFWQVQGIIRYELKDNIYEYRFKNKGRTKKQCEQLVSQNVLRQIYTDFPMLFKKYKQLKLEKGLA